MGGFDAEFVGFSVGLPSELNLGIFDTLTSTYCLLIVSAKS